MNREKNADREYDIVLFGATGFTGTLVAEYLAGAVPEGGRWAVAGRSPEKLRAVVDAVTASHPGAPEPGVVQADSSDRASLAAMASAARVVISTVGPYLEYGEPLVAACAEAGTDYVDLCGEPEFVDRMYLEYDEAARASGARLVPACGFDSIPHDMGVYYTVTQVPEGVPVHMYGGVHADAQFSGGTLHSAMGQFVRLKEASAAARERRRREGSPEGRRVRMTTGRPHKDPVLGRWMVPLPTIDPQIVLRSAAALDYGPDFSYGHYVSLRTPAQAALGVGGLAALVGGARVPLVRNRLLDRFARGSGPSEERRRASSFDVTFVALAGGRTIVTRVSGGDPGYTETAMMLAESALCLAFDPGLPDLAGQLTTAQAMGDSLLGRLEKGGLVFEVLRD